MVGEEGKNPMVMTRRGIDAVHKDVREGNHLALARNGYRAIKWNVKLVNQNSKARKKGMHWPRSVNECVTGLSHLAKAASQFSRLKKARPISNSHVALPMSALW
jgi:hypothetical protein